MGNIIVTPRSLSAGRPSCLERIREAGYQVVCPAPGVQPTVREILAVLDEAVGWLAGVEKITAALLERATKLKVIARNGSGVDNIDLAAATTYGIKVLRAEGANARGVAELTFALLLAAARQLPRTFSELKAGRWVRPKGFELGGKTIGLIGCGQIGKLVARYALAWEMTVLAYDIDPDPSFCPGPGFRWATFEEVIAKPDIISLHCPAQAQGIALLDAAVLASLKPGAIVVNTARESLLDWPALREALNSGRVAAYLVDVFDTEPPNDFDIPKHPLVLATSHLGAHTEESIERAGGLAVDQLLGYLASLN